jgi:hypothetical protein
MGKIRAALGLSVRTGRAVVVVVGAAPADPAVLAKARIDVATTFDEGAVFHMAQQAAEKQSLAAARALVRRREAQLTGRAREAVAAFVATLDAKVVAVGIAAGEEKTLPPFETIVKAHPLLHAAEGELYRRVFAAAGAALRVKSTRVPPAELASRVATLHGLTAAKVTARLAAMGKASGRPWTVDQKQAALAAWAVLGPPAARG